MSDAYEVRVDADLCMGARRCVYLRPDVFDVGADGTAYVKDGALLGEAVVDAARACPNFAIEVRRGQELVVGTD